MIRKQFDRERLGFWLSVIGGLLAAVLTCPWAELGHPLRSLLTLVVGLGLLVISFCVAPLLYDVRPTPSEVAEQVLLAFTKPGCWPAIAGFVIAIVGGWLLLQAEHARQDRLPEAPDSPLIDG